MSFKTMPLLFISQINIIKHSKLSNRGPGGLKRIFYKHGLFITRTSIINYIPMKDILRSLNNQTIYVCKESSIYAQTRAFSRSMLYSDH